MLQHLWSAGAAGAGAPKCLVQQLLAAAPTLSQAASTVLHYQARSSSSSTAAVAAAAGAGDKRLKQPKQQKGKDVSAVTTAAAAEQQQQQQQLALLKSQYQRSRLAEFYSSHLARELLLKLNLSSVQQLPRIRTVDLSISAKDTHGRRYAEKWEMLLPALALEYVTGQPATFVQSQVKYYRSRNAITAVKVRLAGGAALDVLQKLSYLVLPSQNAFSGVSSKSLDRAGNLHFRIQKVINFPDFEEQYEIFEALGSLHFSINMAGTAGQRGRSQLLMTGLQLPMLQKKGGNAAAAEAEAEAAAAAELSADDTDSEMDEDN
ncbi:ribosomal protein L5 domain-containing protein [Scenedesmus sp. NREL 46B-D3]|nr:ribosomal protein L5 domain-containing protein [Scenedesmus sp. NREL 46B-D3]